MATKKITNDNHEFNIDQKSVTYVIDSTLSDSTKILLSYDQGSVEHPNYMMRLRNGNDLVVQYSTNDGHDNYGKIITTTIKNFFLTTYSGQVLFNGSKNLDKNTAYQTNFRLVVNDKTISDTEYTFIYGNSKKNTYILSSNGNVIDPSGNDTYKMASTSNANIWDFKGNDNYDYTGVTSSNITDEKGNDKYYLKSGSAISSLKEKAGNDTYTVVGGSSLTKLEDVKGKDKYTVTDGTLTVQDDAGNDTYKITESSTNIVDNGMSNDTYTLADVSYAGADNLGILDNGGKDKYSFIAVDGNGDPGDTFWATDFSGNDSWSLGGYNNVMIQDGGSSKVSGNDTYKLKEASGISLIRDYGGSNKFTVTDSAFKKYIDDSYGELVIRSYGKGDDKKNNDTYTFKNVEGAWYTVQEQKDAKLPEQTLQESIQIFDDAGNDKFSFTDTDWVYIKTSTTEDDTSKKAGSDTYTLKNSTNFAIYAEGESNDKYTITSSDSVYINDYKGDDKYTITASDITIYDEKGNDTYTLKKLDNSSVVITDINSDKDKLVITGEKYDKTKGVIAVASGYNDNSACNLHLYDTQTGDFATISNFYSITGGEIKGEGSGCIETVKIGSKTIKLTDDQFMAGLNSLNQDVANWLQGTAFSNVDDVFLNGISENISSLVTQVFQGNSAS